MTKRHLCFFLAASRRRALAVRAVDERGQAQPPGAPSLSARLPRAAGGAAPESALMVEMDAASPRGAVLLYGRSSTCDV